MGKGWAWAVPGSSPVVWGLSELELTLIRPVTTHQMQTPQEGASG